MELIMPSVRDDRMTFLLFGTFLILVNAVVIVTQDQLFDINLVQNGLIKGKPRHFFNEGLSLPFSQNSFKMIHILFSIAVKCIMKYLQ
jgi:hypothetical protein